MCTSPIHIKPKSFQSRLLSSDGSLTYVDTPFAYDVPCGKCAECKRAKIDSYFLRCITEFSNCSQRAVFVTLTYNNENLPFITNYDYFDPVYDEEYDELLKVPELKTYSCWNKKHIQTFLKSINEKALYYLGSDVLGLNRLVTINGRRKISDEWKFFLANTARPFKYLVTCERGSADIYVADNGRVRQGTARPHYHLILFITSPLLSIQYVLDLVRDNWTYGLSYNIEIGADKFTKDRDISQSIQYVVKYVCKSINDPLESCYFHSHDDELNYKSFTLISNFVGDTLLDNLTSKELVKKLSDGISVPSFDNDISRNINIPRYNLDKVCKNVISREKITCVRYPDDYTDFFDGFPFLVEHSSDDLESYKRYKVTTAITPVGQELRAEALYLKAEFYADTLELIQRDPVNNFDNLAKMSYSKLSNFCRDELFCMSPLDMFNFVHDFLYFEDDYFERYDIYYRCFCLVREFSATLTRQSTLVHDLNYKSGLFRAMDERPELFTRIPL